MYKYLIDDIAQAELDSVGGVYISYFARLGDSAKGRAWANRFYREYREHITTLKSDPFRYGRCLVYPFDYRTDLTDALCEAVGIDLFREAMTKSQMNKVMSAVKKPRS